MIMDERSEFADDASVAAAAGTALIGDVIDLQGIGFNIGISAEAFLVIRTGGTEIITGGSAGTIKFILASDAQAAIATDGSATVHIDTGTFVTDDAAANSDALNAGGNIFQGMLPLGTYERFLGILCTIATTTVTAGTINAFLVLGLNAWRAYADAQN